MLCVTLGLLSVRTLTSLDLGYNLEYGRQFLRHGTIVDHVDFLYTLPSPDLPVDQRPEAGPGSAYDSEGRYRFVNANWLSQVVMAACYAAGGIVGLTLLAALLSAVVYFCLFVATRRLGLGPVPAIATVGFYALVASWRLNLRPELFAFACLAAQLTILGRLVFDTRRIGEISRSSIVALVLLQVLFVNLHSYFLLGIGIAAAVTAEAALGWLVARRAGSCDDELMVLRRASAVLGLLVAATLVNPFTWRLAILPFQTLVYLREHRIVGGSGDHPWSHITELQSPFSAPFPQLIHDYFGIVYFAVGILGLVAAARRRRLAVALILAGLLLSSVTMERNIASAAIVVIPVALAALARLIGDRLRAVEPAVAIVVIALSALWGTRIVDNRFHQASGVPTRFGIGIGRAMLPVGAAEWLGKHAPHARVWCDTDSSSTLRFFADPQPELPILTNQWAYPPAVMDDNQRIRAGHLRFEATARRYDVQAVVLRTSSSVPLFRALARDASWALVHVEGEYVVFVDSRGDLASVAAQHDLSRFAGDPMAYVRRLRAVDPLVERSTAPAGRILLEAGAVDLAAAVLDSAAEEVRDDAGLWSAAGSAHASRGDRRRQAGAPDFPVDFRRARERFGRALALRPDYEFARRTSRRIDAILDAASSE